MNHSGTVILKTPRLILRRFVMNDAENMYKNWASDELVTRYLTWAPHANVDVTRNFIRHNIENYERPDFYEWAIELTETEEIIGSISVVSISENTNCATLGYCLGKKWWGKGIMPEAASAVIKHLFEQVGFNRISATHDKNNLRSGRVMQKIGMSYEGTLRSAGRNNQGIVDEVCYAILMADYT